MVSAPLDDPARCPDGPRHADGRPQRTDRTLDAVFTAVARRRPQAVVVREGPHALTYGKADLLSSQLATALLRTGVQLGDPVAVQCADHRQALVAQLAVLKAGGVCVPVPPEVSADRAREIAVVSGTGTILCSRSTFDRWDHGGCAQPLSLDDTELWKRAGALRVDRALPRSAPTEPAYLLMTEEGGAWHSGHLVDHRAWQLAMTARSAQTGPAGQTVTVGGSPAATAALSAMWWAFGAGSTLHTRPDGSTAALGGGTVVCDTAQYARLLDPSERDPGAPRPRAVLLVGAPCPPQLVARHFEVLPATPLRAEFAPRGSVLPWAVSVFPAGGGKPAGGGVVAGAAPGVWLSVVGAHGEVLSTGQPGEVCATGRAVPFDVIGNRAGPGGPLLRSGVTGRSRPDRTLELMGRWSTGASPEPGRVLTAAAG
ncbi:AMP-binding protein [Streptomyces xantholiticus]